jgi:hypothetical protein
VPWEEREDGTRRLAAPLPVDGIGALRRLLYERADLVDGGCVVEPRPAGRYLGYGAVVAGGTVVAEVFQERLREQDGLSGVSTLARTIGVDPEVRAAGRALLGHLRFQGAALLEFHRDDAGRLSLLNLIPRLWGSLGLALFAGVDVPRLLLRIAHGETPVPGLVAAPGKLWRWVAGDTDALRGRLRRVFARVEGRSVLHDRAGDVRALVDARAVLQAHPDVFAVDDPLPAALEWQQRLGRSARGGALTRGADLTVR